MEILDILGEYNFDNLDIQVRPRIMNGIRYVILNFDAGDRPPNFNVQEGRLRIINSLANTPRVQALFLRRKKR